MQLEATLKSLWPDPTHALDPMTGEPKPQPTYTFLGKGEDVVTYGHGTAAADAMVSSNDGFLRGRGADEDPSLLVVLLLTDEDDCSSTTNTIFTPSTVGADGVSMEILDTPPNLRCTRFADQLQPIQRYVDGLKALRPGREDLVMFATITGVPQALVSPEARAAVDLRDAAARQGYYEGILADPNMQVSLNEAGNNVAPACEQDDGSEAAPGRRLVEVAAGFGEQGRVYSLCDDDFSGAFADLASAIGKRASAGCVEAD